MAEPASAAQPAVEQARSEVADRVAELREQAAADPLQARDEAWRWFGQLREQAGHEAEPAVAALAELFALGNPPALIEGRTEGILVAPTISGPVDRMLRGISGAWMPWLGKRFDADAQRGDNVLTQSARWPAKLFWPLYGTRPLG